MKIKVKFLNDNGTEVVATFDRDAGTVTAQDGRTGAYSRPDGSKVMELKGAENITLTFQDDVKFLPGFSTGYSGSDGRRDDLVDQLGARGQDYFPMCYQRLVIGDLQPVRAGVREWQDRSDPAGRDLVALGQDRGPLWSLEA
jgi:hypothetical protein